MAKRKVKRRAKTVVRAKRSSHPLENQMVQVGVIFVLLCVLYFVVYGGR